MTINFIKIYKISIGFLYLFVFLSRQFVTIDLFVRFGDLFTVRTCIRDYKLVCRPQVVSNTVLLGIYKTESN